MISRKTVLQDLIGLKLPAAIRLSLKPEAQEGKQSVKHASKRTPLKRHVETEK